LVVLAVASGLFFMAVALARPQFYKSPEGVSAKTR